MELILSADFAKYNANIRGKNVGDCVKRSISLATGTSYNDISKELLQAVKERYKKSAPPDEAWKMSGTYDKVIKAHGGSSSIKVDEIYTLDDFVDNVLGDKGTYLVTTGSKPGTRSNHIVCVIDGKVYDSWDSRDQYVYHYYTFDGTEFNRNTELDIANMPDQEMLDLLNEAHYEDRLESKASAMLSKKNYLDGIFSIRSINRINYKITTTCKVSFPPLAEDEKERIYSFKVDIVATPFETLDSFKKLINKAVDVRLYDRMYAVFQNEAKQREAAEISRRAKQRDEQSAKRLNRNLHMTSAESRFFKSLPGWAQGLVSYVGIQSPAQYHDSYEVYMVPLPDDPYNNGTDVLVFNGYTSSEIKKAIEHYGKTYEVVDPDELI